MNAKNKVRLLALAAFLFTLGAVVLTSPMIFGLSQRAIIKGIERGAGYSLNAPFPSKLVPLAGRSIFFPEEAEVFEDGIMLRGGNTSLKSIELGGWGRIQIQKSKIYFSTSDRGDPGHRTYEISTPRLRVPEWVLSLMWIGILGLWIFLIRQTKIGEPLSTLFENHHHQISIALFLIFIFAMVAWPIWMADAFFLSLWLPVLWALMIGVTAFGHRPVVTIILALFITIPAIATYIYYAVSGSSHGSFLIAGILPWSDARMHFLQAAEIAREGVTQYPFNGRFLYPAYFSSLLWMGGWNLSLANAVAAFLALGILGFACWIWHSKIGVTGTALFAMLCWLYFREFGCGLVMTEVLGFAAGLLSVACLYWGCEKRKLPFFLLGLFWMSMGSSARPGALFTLPLLGLSAGWLAWSWDADVYRVNGWKRLLRPIGVIILAALIVITPFGINTAMGKIFYRGEAHAFGNFVFTLNGLLTGTKWSVSYDATHGDARAVMKENMHILKKEPQRLVTGIRRAYEAALDKTFLYRFGDERRLTGSMKWLALLGILAFGMLPGLRPHAPWVWAGALGIILSVPFAPPWDAGVRPYAATVGLQSLLPAVGLAFILRGLTSISGVKKIFLADTSVSTNGEKVFMWTMSVLFIALVAVLPITRAVFLQKELPLADPSSLPPQFRTGSMVILGREINYDNYQKSLAVFAIGRAEEAKRFVELPSGTQLGINWNNLQIYHLTPQTTEIPAP